MNISFTAPAASESTGWKIQVLDLAVYDRAYQGIAVRDVVMIHGDGNYTTFYISSGKKLMVSRTLKEYAALLDEQVFFRVHKSYLINLHHVQEYDTSNQETVVLRNGLRVGIARRRRKEFEEKAAPYLRRSWR